MSTRAEISTRDARALSFARRVFSVAGVFGLIVILPQYFVEDFVGRTSPPPITHPEYFYGFVGVGLVWQVLFLVIATDPLRYRPAMIAAVLEKLAFGIPCVVLYAYGRVTLFVLGAGLFDLLLAALFAISYHVTPARSMRP